jgi:hypothetical protein
MVYLSVALKVEKMVCTAVDKRGIWMAIYSAGLTGQKPAA